MLTRSVLKIVFPLIALAIGAATSALGADYPTRPVRVIVPVPAVSLATTILRGVSTAMAPDLGTSVVIENNRPGTLDKLVVNVRKQADERASASTASV